MGDGEAADTRSVAGASTSKARSDDHDRPRSEESVDFWALPRHPRRWSALSTAAGSGSSRGSKGSGISGHHGRTGSGTTTRPTSSLSSPNNNNASDNPLSPESTPAAPDASNRTSTASSTRAATAVAVDRAASTTCDGQSAPPKGIMKPSHNAVSFADTETIVYTLPPDYDNTSFTTSGPVSPSIVITPPQPTTSLPPRARAETTWPESSMGRRNRGSSNHSRSASVGFAMSPEDEARVPFPLTIPTPTRSRNDSYSSLRHAPTPAASARYAPARSSSMNYYEPPTITEATRPHLKSFHTDSTGQFIEIPRFKKRELNLTIVRARMTRVWWALLWVFCLAAGLASVFFDINMLYIIIQVAMYPPLQTNARQLWIFTAACQVICWAISIVGIGFGWQLCFQFWRNWNRRYPAIEHIYFSLGASTYLSLASFDHFAFLLHTRLSPLGTSHASDFIPETAYSVLQLLPGLAPLVARAGIASVILISFWRPESFVPLGITLAAASRDSNFFNGAGQLTTYSKGVMLAFISWVLLRVAVVGVSAVLLWWYSFRPFARLRSWSPNRHDPMAAHDPSDWDTPAKSWRDESELQWAWRERTRARIQNAFELCIVRPRYANSEKIPHLHEPATPGLREVLQTPTSILNTPNSVNQTPTSRTALMHHAAVTTPTPDRLTFRDREKNSLDLQRYPPSLGVGACLNGQLNGSALYNEVIVEDQLYRLSEESESPNGSPRWPNTASSGTHYTRGPISAALSSPDDPLPRTPVTSGMRGVPFQPILSTAVEVDPLADMDFGESFKKGPMGLPLPRPPAARSTRSRHESSPIDATFRHREMSTMTDSTASMSMSRFLEYNGTPPPIPPRPNLMVPGVPADEESELEFDTRSHVSGNTNDDLVSLQQFIEREATPSPQLSGSLAFIRFKAMSRSGDNSFEHGVDGYNPRWSEQEPSSLIRVSGNANSDANANLAGLLETPAGGFPKLPPAPSSNDYRSGSQSSRTPASSLGSRAPPSTYASARDSDQNNYSASSRATAGRLSSRVHGSTASRGVSVPASSASSRGGGGGSNSTGSRGAGTSLSSGGGRRAPRPPNIILPPNPEPWIDVTSAPNEFGQFGQLSPPETRSSQRSPTISHVGLSLIPPSPSTVWASLPHAESQPTSPFEAVEADGSRSRRGSHFSGSLILPPPAITSPSSPQPQALQTPPQEESPPPKAKAKVVVPRARSVKTQDGSSSSRGSAKSQSHGHDPRPRRRRTQSVLGFEFEMMQADASGHAVAIEEVDGSDGNPSREGSGVSVDTQAVPQYAQRAVMSSPPSVVAAQAHDIPISGLPPPPAKIMAGTMSKYVKRASALQAAEGIFDRLRRLSDISAASP